MSIADPDVAPYVIGTHTQCELASRVIDLINLVNQAKALSNENEADIGNVDLLSPAFTDLTSAILDLQSNQHLPATGIAPIVVDTLTQEVSFNIQSFVDQLALPINSLAVAGLKTLIDTNTFITSISYNPSTHMFDMVYNTGLTSSFAYGLSTDAENDLTYGSDGLPYFNISTLQFLP